MKTRNLASLFFILMCNSFANAQNTGMPSKESLAGDVTTPQLNGKQIQGDTILPHLDLQDSVLKQRLMESSKAFKTLIETKVDGNNTRVPESTPPLPQPVPRASKNKSHKDPMRDQSEITKNPIPQPVLPPPQIERTEPFKTSVANNIQVYAQNGETFENLNTVTLPSGSIALATVLYGVQVTPDSIDKVLPVELEYTWLGPNKAVVEMKGCRAWIQIKADMNIERILGIANSLACRASDGTVFELPIRAHLVNKNDEYLGAEATLVLPGKAQAAALLFLQNGVEAFGKAMAAAQLTQNSSAGAVGAAVKSENVTGNQNKYIVGSVLEQSSSKFLNWFVSYYSNLSPQLAIGPGHKVYLALEGSVQIPKVFFGKDTNAMSLKDLESTPTTNTRDITSVEKEIIK